MIKILNNHIFLRNSLSWSNPAISYSLNELAIADSWQRKTKGENMYWIWVLIVGGLIGLVAGAITKRGGSMGWIANIIAGLVGSSLGQALLGSWGPSLAGMAIIPSLVGAIILVLIVSLIFGVKKDPA